MAVTLLHLFNQHKETQTLYIFYIPFDKKKSRNLFAVEHKVRARVTMHYFFKR